MSRGEADYIPTTPLPPGGHGGSADIAIARAAVRAFDASHSGREPIGREDLPDVGTSVLPDLLCELEDVKRRALSQALTASMNSIRQRQLTELRRRFHALDGLNDLDVLDDLPDTVRRIADVIGIDGGETSILAGTGIGDAPVDGTDILRMQSSAHAAARYGQGFGTGEIGAEYALLRMVIKLELAATLGRELIAVESLVLHAAVDEASNAALISFAALREKRARLEAEAMSRFLSSLAHDLRNGLGGAMMSMQLVSATLDDAFDKKKIEDLRDDITESHGLLDSTVNTMTRVLEAERLRAGAGAVNLRPRRVELRPFMLSASRSASRTSLTASDGLEIDVVCDPEAVVETDPDLLTSILLNFLSNAVRFGNGKPITLKCEASGDGFVIGCTDRGSGIAADRLEQLFDRFHRGGRNDGQGLGLGLFIARCAADLINAKLDVQSEPGVGTTFSLTLPRALSDDA